MNGVISGVEEGMESPSQALPEGTGVRIAHLDTTAGFLIKKKTHIKLRRPDVVGVVVGQPVGHKDVYWVLHEGEELPAVYLIRELELEDVPVVWPVTYQHLGADCCEEYATIKGARSNCTQHRKAGVVKDPVIQSPVFEDRDPVLGPVRTPVERPSAWDRLQDYDV